MIHPTNNRFRKFLRHIDTQHGGWISEDRDSFTWVFRSEECSSIDLILRELLQNIDTETLENDKGFMQLFNIRYLVLDL